jgi:ABC-2 type transport system ATP-binding protein
MLEAKNLTKTYGTLTALNNLNLTIEAGEIFALLGQNGAGKTTTINLFLGFIEPTHGTASIHGISVADHPQEIKSTLPTFQRLLCFIQI